MIITPRLRNSKIYNVIKNLVLTSVQFCFSVDIGSTKNNLFPPHIAIYTYFQSDIEITLTVSINIASFFKFSSRIGFYENELGKLAERILLRLKIDSFSRLHQKQKELVFYFCLNSLSCDRLLTSSIKVIITRSI